MAEKNPNLTQTRPLKHNWSLLGYRIKIFFWRFLGALMFEPKGNKQQYAISLGRVLLLVTLGFLITLWVKSMRGHELPIPEGLMEVFYVLAGYVFGGKVVEAVRRRG